MRVEARLFAREVELADGGLNRVVSAVSPLVSARTGDGDRIHKGEIKRRPEGTANNDDDRYRQMPGVARYLASLARTRWPLLRPRACGG